MSFTLPNLPYAYDVLEPYIDAQTMQIHHQKHHGGYVNKLNKALENQGDLSKKTIEEIITNLNDLPEEIRSAVRKNGGGHYNHSLFWQILLPGEHKTPEGNVAKAINEEFGSFDSFKDEFTQVATSRFGSGWAWLCTRQGKLNICSTPNQDNPLMDVVSYRSVPILGLDVWEHAYYLKYQNKRADYINNFWNVINWKSVETFYNTATKLEVNLSQTAAV